MGFKGKNGRKLSLKKLHKILSRVYFNPSSPVAFAGVNAVYKHVTSLGHVCKRSAVQTWLSKQLSYSLHKPARRRFRRRPVIVNSIDHQWQADLLDVANRKNSNNGITFLLTVVDVLSKKAWVRPLVNKRGFSIVNAFIDILDEGRAPQDIITDAGNEFLNVHFQALLRERGIRHFTARDGMFHC